jgi:hypothetical protein
MQELRILVAPHTYTMKDPDSGYGIVKKAKLMLKSENGHLEKMHWKLLEHTFVTKRKGLNSDTT